MGALGTLLVTLFGSFIGRLAEDGAKKIATIAIAVAAFALALTALMLMFNTVVAPLVQSMFSTSFGQFIGLAFPPISGTCMTAITTAWGGCALYKLKVQSIKMSASA